MKLKFEDKPMTFSHLNVRAEQHGEDKEPAGDLKFEADLPNECLDMLVKGLKEGIYHYDPKRADLADDGRKGEKGYLPHLRWPNLQGPLKWEDEMQNVELSIREKGAKTLTTLEEVKVNSVEFTPKDGGTVHLKFRVQAKPDEKCFGRLTQLIQTEVEVTLKAA